MLICIVCLLFLSCATKEEAPAPPPALSPEPTAEPLAHLPRVFIPIQTVYILEKNNGEDIARGRFLAFHIDRRDGYSVMPERLILEPGVSTSITPIVTLGERSLDHAEMIILRTSPSKYAAQEPEFTESSFNFNDAETAEIPEFIIYSSGITQPLLILPKDMKNRRKGIRKGVEDLNAEAASYIREILLPEQFDAFEQFLSRSRVFSDYEGIHSAALFPFGGIDIPDYSEGADIVITPERSFTVDEWRSFSSLDFQLISRRDSNPYPEITLGDMGVFSGGTVLLKPDLFSHTRHLVSMNNIHRMPGSPKRAASPVTMEGSFNIYRDERNRYLWYPGIISYIPGFHPDISGGDIEILFNTQRAQLDAFLESEKELYFGTKVLAGGLPVFFLAAPSARALEMGYERDSEVRAMLAEFLNRPAYNVRFFE